jgi:hypothetical protein
MNTLNSLAYVGSKTVVCAAMAIMITVMFTQFIFSGDGPSRRGVASTTASVLEHPRM